MGEKTVIAKSLSSFPEPQSTQSSDASTGWDGVAYKRPYDFATLLEAAQINPYHQRCITIKALMSVGLGFDVFMGDAPDEESKSAWKALWPGGFDAEMLKIALDLETFGNAYIEAVRNTSSVSASQGRDWRAKALYHVPAVTMHITKEGFRQEIDGKPGYKDFADFFATPTPRGASEDRGIIHLKLYSPKASIYGIPDWIGCLNSIILDANATEFNYQFFNNNCIPAWAIIVRDGTLSDDSETAIKNFFAQKHKGVVNAHKTLLLTANGAEIDFKPLQVEAKDMSFEKLKEICRYEVVTAHGVPPRMVGIIQAGQLGGGGEMQWQLRSFKEGVCKSRQGFYSSRLADLLPDGIEIRFHEMDVTDTRDDAEFYQLMVQAGILTPNEARGEMGYEKLQGIDEAALSKLLGGP